MRAIHLASVFILALTALKAGTNTVTATSCADRVSTGDQSCGITAVEDASCASGGLGCFPDGDQCRFCRTSNTAQSDHLKLCSDILVSGSVSPTKTPGEEEAIDCLAFISVGDNGAGISAVAATKPTCAANGLGCFQTGQCRFCKTRETTQSAPYLRCADVGGSSTSTPTSAPTYAPAATVASTSTVCSSVVSRSGLKGISYVIESRCNVANPTLLGCSARTSCRLCRNFKDEVNQYLVSCQVLKDLGAVTESAEAGSSITGSTGSTTLVYPFPSDTLAQGSGPVTVTTKSDPSSVAAKVSGGTAPIAAAAAVVALLVVVMMSVIYVKGRRDPLDECMTPDDDGDGGDLMTPHGGYGYTPREGSLVMVVSQTSIATL